MVSKNSLLRLSIVVLFILTSSVLPTYRVYAVDPPVDIVDDPAADSSTQSPATSEGFNEQFYSDNDIYFFDPNASLCAYSNNGGSTVVKINSAAIDKSFSLGTDNAMRPVNLAKQLKTDFGLTDAQAAGIVGNFMHESGGAHVPPDINENTSIGAPPAFKGGYGWAQWTGGRQVAFIDFAITKGYITSKSERANDAANYAYLKYELIEKEIGTIPAVAKTNTPTAAATAFEAAFERAGKPLLEKRIKFAEQVFQALQTGSGVSSAASAPTTQTANNACSQVGTGIATGGKVFETVVFPLSVTKKDILNASIFSNGTTNRAGHPYIAFDIYAKAKTPVVALTDGEISSVKIDGSMGGNVTVYVKSKDLHVYYTHMRPLATLKVGQSVTPGMLLGALISVKDYPSINTDHLHIDAGSGKFRLGCSRTNPGGAGCKTRVDIGPDLFSAWEKVGS